MRIKNLKLLNFRNHKKISFDFKKTNLVTGANGSGKTSILEAVFLLATSKSPRTNHNQDLIKWDGKKSFLELKLQNENAEGKIIRLEINRKKNGNAKTFSLDGVILEPKKIVGLFKAIYFSPETLDVITGSPHLRRRFVDILLAQINPKYLNNLIEYKKILLNRNKLLKEIGKKRRDKKEIIFWDMKLVEFGVKIMQVRQRALADLRVPFKNYYQKITKTGQEAPDFKYHPSFHFERPEDIENLFNQRIVAELEFEIKYGSTIFGPHRDDLRFYFYNRPAASFCSRGEIRSMVIALKMAEADYIRKKTGQKPIILLDDIFSELDAKRSVALFELIFGKYQVIITSAEEKISKKVGLIKTKIIKLKETKYV